jgi:hypothetical protein
MRSLSLTNFALLALGTAFVASIPVSAQSSASHKQVFGYQDSVTGEFRPAARVAPDATVTPTTGTDSLVLTITLKTPLPKGGSILCSSSLTGVLVYSTGLESLFVESASSVATVSGTTATCTVNTPYAWLIAAGTTEAETYSGSYTVEMTSAASTLPGVVRLSEGTYVSATKIPSTGTTSKYTVAVTL